MIFIYVQFKDFEYITIALTKITFPSYAGYHNWKYIIKMQQKLFTRVYCTIRIHRRMTIAASWFMMRHGQHSKTRPKLFQQTFQEKIVSNLSHQLSHIWTVVGQHIPYSKQQTYYLRNFWSPYTTRTRWIGIGISLSLRRTLAYPQSTLTTLASDSSIFNPNIAISPNITTYHKTTFVTLYLLKIFLMKTFLPKDNTTKRLHISYDHICCSRPSCGIYVCATSKTSQYNKSHR